MEIQVDSATIAAAAAKSIERGVNSAFESWDIQKALKEAATSAILESAIVTAVDEAVEMIEIKHLATVISQQLLEQIHITATMCLEDAAVNTIYRMRYHSSYISQEDESKHKDEIREEIRNRRTGGV